jgi:hypothetical protein
MMARCDRVCGPALSCFGAQPGGRSWGLDGGEFAKISGPGGSSRLKLATLGVRAAARSISGMKGETLSHPGWTRF